MIKGFFIWSHMIDKGDALSSVAIVFVSTMLTPLAFSEQQAAENARTSINEDHSSNSDRQMSSSNISAENSSVVLDNGDNGNFTSLFDGNTLDNWKMAGNGRFVIVEEDDALQSEKGGGILWYSKKQYDNFVLKLEWKVSDAGDNSGIFLRFPNPEDDPAAVREGYEVQIDDKGAPTGDAIRKTGAIFDLAAPSKFISKPPGQWNTMEVQVDNQCYVVAINGENVTKFTGNRLTEGYIGLQAHDDQSKVSFRNILIKEVRP
jgi:hypothetical protein